jgi:aubergine-like protein
MKIHSLLNLIQLNSVSLENDRNNNYANALENELSNHHYDIVMCVLRSNRADTYKVIKNITFCRLGIASQV